MTSRVISRYRFSSRSQTWNQPQPYSAPQTSQTPVTWGRLDVTTLDSSLHFFTHRGLADTTHRTYKAGVNRYLSFCTSYNIIPPFAASETVLCYFVVFLGLAPGTMRTYLAAVRHEQIVRGMPEIRQCQLPRLHLVQAGVRRERALQGETGRQRLPITIDILCRLQFHLLCPAGVDVMLWDAWSSCFFGHFCSGEITVPSARAFEETTEERDMPVPALCSIHA